MTGPANRGKSAEQKIKDYLKLLNDGNMHFCYNRNLDAHAAGGKFQAVPGDFQAFVRIDVLREHLQAPEGYICTLPGDAGSFHLSRNYIIEVKQVKHDFRLPHGNYSVDKVARVEKRCKAGTEAIVMIHHSTNDTWRAVPHEVFRTRTGGSWDLREFPVVDYRTALSEFMGVLP